MSQDEELFQQLLQIVQKYYPYENPYYPSWQEIQERNDIVRQNWKSVQKWQEFAGNYVEYDKRPDFIDQINTALKIYPLVTQYLTMKSHGLSLKKVETVEVEQYYQQQPILQAFQIKSKQRIIQHLNSSSNIQEYLVKQVSFIVDILQRRSKLNDYFRFLVQQSKNIPHFVQKIGSMDFVDFIIVLQKITYPNDIISFLIAQQGGPSPVQFTALDQHINYADLLVSLLKFKKHHLVLNVWSANSKKYVGNRMLNNQRVLFCNAMQIDQICFVGSHFEEVINLYKLNIRQKEMVFIDYIEKEKQYVNQQNNLVIQLFKQAQIVIFHLDQKDLQQPLQNEITNNYLFFLQKYYHNKTYDPTQIIRFFCQQISNKILISNINKAIKNFYPSVANADILRYQMNIAKPSLQSFYKIFQSLGKQENKKIFDVNSLSPQKLKKHTHYEEIMNFLTYQISHSPKIQTLPKICKQKELNKVRAQKNTLSIQAIRQQVQEQLKKQNGGQNHTKTTLQVLQIANEQYMKALSKLSQQQKTLKKQLLVKELSAFVQSCKRYIKQEDGIQIQEFIDGLIQKTNEILNKQLSILSQAFPGEMVRTPEYKAAKDRVMSNRVSIDEIYYQYNVYNELTIDKDKQNPTSFQQFYINQYYQKCLNTQNSFNTVDGETSNFGNKSLQRFFQQIKRKQEEEYKEIFVISFIGSKSSGKSTLSNYLFHFNIHMREDEFAKGIYVGQCQMSKKTIIVLDTAGIMNIDFAKDNYEYTAQQLGRIFATFDHQVASLLLKASDLVVFAGFTEQKKDHLIPQQLQLAVGVCYKVLNAIQVNNYSDQKKFTPKRIMFALNKKSETSPNIDKELAIQLMLKHLQPILLLQVQDPNGEKDPRKLFQKYMRLQAQDIFQLPNLYQNSQNVNVLKINETYGLQILGFRSKILKHLEIIKNHRVNAQQMIGFYRKAQANWDVIMVTGSNILKAQSLTESYERQFIFQLFRSLYPKIYQQMIKDIDKVLPETNCEPLTFTSKQVQQLIGKQQQQSTFDSWTFFSIKLNVYLTDIYKKQGNKPSTYQSIIAQSTNIFQMQAQKTIQNLQKYQDLYVNSIKKLFDVLFYRRIKEYYRLFESVFATGIRQYTFGLILETIQNLNVEGKYNRKERQQIFDRQTNKILNSEYFKPIKREVVSSNLNSLFGTILSTENVFIQELQIQSINDCLTFDQQINQRYINNLNQFIYFENYQEVKQNYRAQFARLIENNIKEFNQSVVKAFSDKVISSDIRDNFQYVKNYIIDTQTNKLSDQIFKVSKRIYAQIAVVDEVKSKRYDQLQLNLEQEEIQLDLKKAEKVNSLQQIQASLDKISLSLEEATSEEQKILKKQQAQLLLQKQKLTQELEEIERQITYIFNLRVATNSLSSQRIALTKINFVILLLAKLFNNLQQIIYSQQVAQLNQFKATYVNDVNNSRQQAITYLEQISSKFLKSIEEDYQACSVRWGQQFEDNLTLVYKTTVAQKLKNNSKIILKDRVEGDTIKNKQIELQNLNYEQRKKLHIQCYKYVINPQRYLIEALNAQLSASSQIAGMIDQAYASIQTQIDQILQFKVSSPQPQNHETERRKFLKDYKLNKMLTFVTTPQDIIVYSTEEIIRQFQKKLAANSQSLKKTIKGSANQQQIIDHIRVQVIGQKDQFLGCTQGCPLCGAMCINIRYHGGYHNTSHTNTAFRGCRDSNSHILLKNCTNPLKKDYWCYNYVSYKDHLIFLNKIHQNWAAEFSNSQAAQPAQQQTSNYLKVWANIQEAVIEVFKKRYQFKYGIKQSINPVVVQERKKNLFVNQNDIKANKLENYWVSVVNP